MRQKNPEQENCEGKEKMLGTMEMVYNRNRYMEGKGKYNRPGRRI